MTQGNKETVVQYIIKIGQLYLGEINIGYSLEDGRTPILMNFKLTHREKEAFKWYFDSLSEAGTVADSYEEDGFVEALNLLEENGMSPKVFKTSVVTTVEQKEVSFVNGKEKKEEIVFPSQRIIFNKGADIDNPNWYNSQSVEKFEGVKVTLTEGEKALPRGIKITSNDGSYVEIGNGEIKLNGHKIFLDYPES